MVRSQRLRSKPSEAYLRKMDAALKKRGRIKGGWLQIPESIRERVNLASRQAAANVMNDLAERGPGYTGKFRDSWRAIPLVTGSGSGSVTGYPYSTRNIPQLSLKASQLSRVSVFEIVNTTGYALIAMDLIPGRFIKPKEQPIGGIDFGITVGLRGEDQIRGNVEDVGLEPKNISTAELDWYENYLRGGELSAAVKRAIKFGFRRGSSGIVIQ